MLKDTTDSEWEELGATDPYYSVITQERFRKDRLTDEARAEFFRSGQKYIDEVLDTIQRLIEPSFQPKRALDFGCGVGRLVIPLAGVAERVTGVDVSDSMLEEARRNCEARRIGNIDFVRSDDVLSRLTESYDFIHSIIVFQHIPVARGEILFGNLLDRLADGGVCVAHFTYGKTYAPKILGPWIKRHVPLTRAVINLLKGRNLNAPEMQMNDYDLNRLVRVMQDRGVRAFHAQLTDHGGDLGVLLYFRKEPRA